ncbi:MAG: SMP-30/gluconolactonase/LRE family protein [Verrucomicrobiae bacterium]|nr:SMP-30/gluconolactonase/LRE family protein [Verrucomicrobiae bacterium]
MQFRPLLIIVLVVFSGFRSVDAEDDALFVAKPFTDSETFTGGIEGPACDREGNLYAVSFQDKGNIGVVTPDGAASLFVTLPEGSTGNGIRFDREGIMYVADYTGHKILRIDPATKAISVLAHEPKMNQPNDLAIGPDGTLYASDPNWKDGTGQLWRIDPDGTVTQLAESLGTTNGIEVSPDGKILYVNESVQRKIWAFTLTEEKTITDKWLVKEFADHGFDGMRCDIDGNLYVSRHGAGKVLKMTPKGEVLREIDVLGSMPSNLCFGGSDGRTVYVTEVEKTRVVTFRVDRPGLSWQRWQESKGGSATSVTEKAKKGEVRDLFLVAGQSNAVGFDADPAELSADPNDAKVRFWYRAGDPPPDEHDVTSGDRWISLQPQPKGTPKPKEDGVPRQYGNFSHAAGGFGPEIAFARTLLAKQPQRKIAIVKAAFSGTGIGQDWDPDDPGEAGSCYRALLEEVKDATAAAKAEGTVLRLRALLWVQGESDAKPGEVDLYDERLAKMIASLREDLGTTDMAALVAVNTQFGLGKNPHMPAIVEAQKAVAKADPRTVYVDTAAAPIINAAHYSTEGTLDVGRWFAEAWMKLEGAGAKPTAAAASKAKGKPVPPAPIKIPADMTVHRGIDYAIFGERKVAMDVFVPAGDGPFPGVLLVHGGGWTGGKREAFEPFAVELAKRGYVVGNVDYRLATEAKFPGAVLDCKAAVRWLRAHAKDYRLDPERIGGVGGSAGGHLTGMVATTGHDPSKFEETGNSPGQSAALQAAVLMGAGVDQVTRVKEAKNQRIENCVIFFGAEFSENPDIYAQGSPITHVSKETPPLLFLDGEFDMPGERYVEMRKKLDTLGVPNEFVMIPGAKHGQWGREPWLTPFVDTVDAFFQKHLK